MSVREFPMTVVTRPLKLTGSSESLYIMLVDHVIGDKIHLHQPLRVALRDNACEQGYEGEMGFVWFIEDGSGAWVFNIPDNPAWMQYFDNDLDPVQFNNVVGTVSVDMDKLAAAV